MTGASAGPHAAFWELLEFTFFNHFHFVAPSANKLLDDSNILKQSQD